MSKIRPNVFLVGASGVGKTTLANYLAPTHGLALIPSKTSEIAAECGGWETLHTSVEARKRFQFAVWLAALERVREAVRIGRPFLADRTFDCLAYTSEESPCVWQMSNGDGLREMREYMLDKPGKMDSLGVVLFLRPTRQVHEQALKSDGGRRAEYLEWDRVMRIDGAIQFLLEHLDIPYLSVHSPGMKDRVRLADRVIHLATR